MAAAATDAASSDTKSSCPGATAQTSNRCDLVLRVTPAGDARPAYDVTHAQILAPDSKIMYTFWQDDIFVEHPNMELIDGLAKFFHISVGTKQPYGEAFFGNGVGTRMILRNCLLYQYKGLYLPFAHREDGHTGWPKCSSRWMTFDESWGRFVEMAKQAYNRACLKGIECPAVDSNILIPLDDDVFGKHERRLTELAENKFIVSSKDTTLTQPWWVVLDAVLARMAITQKAYRTGWGDILYGMMHHALTTAPGMSVDVADNIIAHLLWCSFRTDNHHIEAVPRAYWNMASHVWLGQVLTGKLGLTNSGHMFVPDQYDASYDVIGRVYGATMMGKEKGTAGY